MWWVKTGISAQLMRTLGGISPGRKTLRRAAASVSTRAAWDEAQVHFQVSEQSLRFVSRRRAPTGGVQVSRTLLTPFTSRDRKRAKVLGSTAEMISRSSKSSRASQGPAFDRRLITSAVRSWLSLCSARQASSSWVAVVSRCHETGVVLAPGHMPAARQVMNLPLRLTSA
jgi:hypothetical protein